MTIDKKQLSYILVRLLMFAIAAAAIVYFIPRETARQYVFEVNRPWSYPLLTAPFDIPVNLDSTSAQTVRDSIERSFVPVFRYDEDRKTRMLAEFARRLSAAEPQTLNLTERSRMLAQLQAAYADGVVDGTTYEAIRAGRLPQVRMIENNVARPRPTAGYVSTVMVYSQMDSVYADARHRDAMRRAGLADLLVATVYRDTAESKRFHDEMVQRALAPVGVLQKGERIIDRGDIVTPQLYTILSTYETMLRERGISGMVSEHYYPIGGQTAYVVLLLGALFTFLFVFRRDYLDNINQLTFILALMTAAVLLAFWLSRLFGNGLYITPLAIVPIMGVIFLDSRTAWYCGVIVSMLCALASASPLEFFFLQFLAILAATVTIRDLSRRSQLLRSALAVFVAYGLGYVAYEFMQGGTLYRVQPRMFGAFAVNAVLISFAYILVLVVEKLFGFTSRVTLVELSDINNPVLRELSEECPGTFNHSMSVSTLASAAASRIGADVQLVRAGALYHDIGKIANPAFFTENQHGVNPHDALAPQQSARIVIGHVREGLRRAAKEKLPRRISDFIAEHHGLGTARYFYTTECNNNPGKEIDPAPYTYPGPNPQSRETSVLMMADAVEAASRSLNDYSEKSIRALVDKIIDGQVAEGLHADSPISFRDVKRVKEAFVSRLLTMYHSRVSYPEKLV